MVDSNTLKTSKSFVVNIEQLIEEYAKSSNGDNISHFNQIMFNKFLNLAKDEFLSNYGGLGDYDFDNIEW